MKEVSMRPWQTAAVAVLVFLLAFSALLILSPSSEGQERTLRFALTPSEETTEPQMKRHRRSSSGWRRTSICTSSALAEGGRLTPGS
jgi:hypothetical protein